MISLGGGGLNDGYLLAQYTRNNAAMIMTARTINHSVIRSQLDINRKYNEQNTCSNMIINLSYFQLIGKQPDLRNKLIIITQGSLKHMQETQAFNFTGINNEPQSNEFKKQRQAYLAQRNARKLEALKHVRQQVKDLSSSDDEPQILLKAPVVQMKTNEPQRTNSSKSFKYDFKQERQLYKETRLARQKEMRALKKQQFGSSSQDQYFPIEKDKIQTEIKKISTPQLRYMEAPKNDFFFSSLDLDSKKPKNHKKLRSVKLKTQNPEKSIHNQRFQVEIPSKKGVDVWVQKTLQFKEHSLQLGETNLPIYTLNKIKLFFTRTQSGCLKFKLTQNNQQFNCAINHTKGGSMLLDSYYQIFARVITLKLQLMGKGLTQKKKGQVELSYDLIKDAAISGKVRKSSFFSGWEERIGVINSMGLSIYKVGKEKPILVIPYNSLNELWTRFEFDQQNLILKLLHGSSKIQLSIPIDNFLSRNNWLYHIYSLAQK